MISLRKFIVFLMFSAFLVGCQTPLIDIDVKHSSGGGQANGGGTCHWWIPPQYCNDTGGASTPLVGKLTGDPADENVKVYTIKVNGIDRTFNVPPWTVIGNPGGSDTVKVTFSNGVIEKVVVP